MSKDEPDVAFVKRVRKQMTSFLGDIGWQEAEPFLLAASRYITELLESDAGSMWIVDDGLTIMLDEPEIEWNISFETMIRRTLSAEPCFLEENRRDVIESLEKALAFARSYDPKADKIKPGVSEGVSPEVPKPSAP